MFRDWEANDIVILMINLATRRGQAVKQFIDSRLRTRTAKKIESGHFGSSRFRFQLLKHILLDG